VQNLIFLNFKVVNILTEDICHISAM